MRGDEIKKKSWTNLDCKERKISNMCLYVIFSVMNAANFRHRGRVVKATDSKSVGVPPRRFESCRCRFFVGDRPIVQFLMTLLHANLTTHNFGPCYFCFGVTPKKRKKMILNSVATTIKVFSFFWKCDWIATIIIIDGLDCCRGRYQRRLYQIPR